jgi:hypothetical protein
MVRRHRLSAGSGIVGQGCGVLPLTAPNSLAFGMTLSPSKYRPPVHHGAAHPMAKLTAEQVLEILISDESQNVIAGRMGVHQSRISRIRAGKSWSRR